MTDSREAGLQALIEATAGDAPGVLLGVHAPLQGLDFRGAAGSFSLEDNTSMRPGHSFRIASMSKSFTGALIARQMERGALALTDSIVNYLPAELVDKLPVQSGGRREDITIAHLLNHRAGFHDFATSDAWMQELAADPARFRPPLEIAHWALEHTELVGAPGENHHYSDTGYVLLGLILECIVGKSYDRQCREQILDPLQMDSTYLEGHESPRGKLSHPYIVLDGEYIDALQVNGSCDWAGGGHVSTLEDIQRFLRGLFHCRLFDRIDTLDQFLGTHRVREGFYYGMGVGRKQLHGLNLWGHLGHWGSFMYYCPEQRLSMTGTLNYDRADHNAFIERVLQAIYQT